MKVVSFIVALLYTSVVDAVTPGIGTTLLPILEITHTVLFEIELKENYRNLHLGNFTIGLFGKIVPKTVEKFLSYVRGQGKGNGYEGTTFHRVIQDFIIQGGDLTGDDGESGFNKSLWFPSENFDLKHYSAGWVSLANAGIKNETDTNGSQFFITLVPTTELDGLNVVFGKILTGMPVIRKIEHVEVDPKNNDKPLKKVVIKKCNATDLVEPFPTTLRTPVPENI